MCIGQLLDTACQAAIKAGKSILKVYELRDFQIELKTDQSPLTLADQVSHQVICQELHPTGLPVLSEEGSSTPYEERIKWEYFWLVDPLDGTKEFLKRNGEFTVNIALIHKNIPVAGVIYAPCLDTLYYGCEQTGAFKNEKGMLSRLSSLVERKKWHQLQERTVITVVASRSHMTPETEHFISQFKSVQLESMGSSLKLMLLVENQADIYPRLAPTMEWDIAAGHAILNTLNRGVYHTNFNSELVYNKEDLLNPSFIAF